MIRFFQINDPFRAVGILFILLVLRLPYIIGGVDYLNPEMNWMLLGEKIQEGRTLYLDIDTNTGVLSALVYWILHLISFRSSLTYQIIALLVVFIQSVLLNSVLNRLDVQKEKSYLPALFYALLSSVYIDFFTLSPALMANTFLILAIYKLFQNLKFGQTDNGIFMVGFYIGVASLFFFPSIWYAVLAVFALLFYTSTSLRRYIILVFASFFPYLLAATYFYWIGGLKSYLLDTFVYSLSVEKFYYLHWGTLLIIFSVPTLVMILGIFQVSGSTGFINFQQRCNRIMLVWVVISVAMVGFAYEISAFTFALFIPAAAYFISGHFTLIRRKIPRFVIFTFFLLSILFTGVGSVLPNVKEKGWFDNTDLKIRQDPTPPEGRILILGKNRSYFQHEENTMAGKYLEWKLSRRYFEQLDDMRTISFLYDHLQDDLPEAIIDENELMTPLTQRIPVLGEMYYQVDGSQLYRLRPHKKHLMARDH